MPALFTQQQTHDLADSIAESLAMGELLGRARIRLRAAAVAPGVATFAEPTPPLQGGEGVAPVSAEHPPKVVPTFQFNAAIQPLPPTAALDYFRSLVPSLDIDPATFAAGIQRQAFTLAVSTSQALTDRVKQIILGNLQSGEGTRSGAIDIADTLEAAGVTPRNPQYAEMVYRTNAIGAYNRGAANELQAPVVKDIFPVWQYMGINDGRERERHLVHNGKYYPNSVTFEEVRDSEAGKYDGYNCILPGQELQGKVTAGLKARYTGDAVELLTTSGRRLSITPNHPILTDTGFKPAHAIKKGDNLLGRHWEYESLGSGENDIQDMPPTVDQIFESLAQMRSAVLSSEPVVTFNLHGDVEFIKGDVQVIRADRELLGDDVPQAAESVSQSGFVGNYRNQTLLPGGRPGGLDFRSVPLSSPCGMGRDDLSGPSSAAHAGPLQCLRFGPAANINVTLTQPAGEDAAADAALVAELLQRRPADVSRDQVIEVRNFQHDGPVYDFESPHGWIIVSGIFVSNCRCTFRPISKWEWAKLQASGARIDPAWHTGTFAEQERASDGRFGTKAGDHKHKDDSPKEEPKKQEAAKPPAARPAAKPKEFGIEGHPHNEDIKAIASLPGSPHTVGEIKQLQAAAKDAYDQYLKAPPSETGAAIKRMEAAAEAHAKASKGRTQALNTAREATVKHLAAANPSTASTPEVAKGVDPKGASRILSVAQGISGMVEGGHHVAFNVLNAANAKDGSREYAIIDHKDGRGAIAVTGATGEHTAAHEFGHLVEWAVPGAREAANAFVARRCGDEKPANLSEVNPAGGYAPDETGRKDNFDAAFPESSAYYCGKQYADGSTEIVSMGLQMLWANPVHFARKDPDFFGFIVSILKGKPDATKH